VNAEPARPVHYVVSWGKPDDDEEPDRELDPGEYRRDGRIFQTPRYGVGGDQRDDGVVDGELSPSATLIEHKAEAVIEAIAPEPPSPPTPTPAHLELLRLRPDKADAFDRHCHAATDLQSSWSPGSQWDGEDQLRWIPLPAGDH
jgi:hypothetical protein